MEKISLSWKSSICPAHFSSPQSARITFCTVLFLCVAHRESGSAGSLVPAARLHVAGSVPTPIVKRTRDSLLGVGSGRGLCRGDHTSRRPPSGGDRGAPELLAELAYAWSLELSFDAVEDFRRPNGDSGHRVASKLSCCLWPCRLVLSDETLAAACSLAAAQTGYSGTSSGAPPAVPSRGCVRGAMRTSKPAPGAASSAAALKSSSSVPRRRHGGRRGADDEDDTLVADVPARRGVIIVAWSSSSPRGKFGAERDQRLLASTSRCFRARGLCRSLWCTELGPHVLPLRPPSGGKA